MRRLIHYSSKPLTKVHSTTLNHRSCGIYKTAGLWVSAEGPDDWLHWCQSESFGLDGFKRATEVVLHKDANVCFLKSAAEIDTFTDEFAPAKGREGWDRALDWQRIRAKWMALIIAPYCWERRHEPHTGWYYGWDCASGVIWNAKAVKELIPLPAPVLEDVT